MLRRITSDSKRLLTLAVWGNFFGFLCANIVLSEKFVFSKFSFRDSFEIVLCFLIFGFLGGYYTAKETNSDNQHNIVARFIENVWFTAMMSLVLGLPGFALGIAFR